MNEFLKYKTAYYLKLQGINMKEFNRNKTLPKYSQVFSKEDSEAIITGFDNYGDEIVILFLEDNKAKEIINFFEKEDIVLDQRNITSDLLTNQLKDKALHYIISSKENSKVLQKFYHANLSIDDVLDKIIDFGIDSLTPTDKEILKL